jgi:monomeric isocitrate dehydrogenase
MGSDLVFHFNADPDPAFHLMRIRIFIEVPLLAGGVLLETGAGGPAPKHVPCIA